MLLYGLLTGRQPYVLTLLTTDELVRVICHEQPRSPSEGEVPYGKFGTDLDCIVLKALRKEAEQRYATVQQLSGDVLAYLEQQRHAGAHLVRMLRSLASPGNTEARR